MQYIKRLPGTNGLKIPYKVPKEKPPQFFEVRLSASWKKNLYISDVHVALYPGNNTQASIFNHGTLEAKSHYISIGGSAVLFSVYLP